MEKETLPDILLAALRDAYDRLSLLLVTNIVTLLLLIPVVTAPPALAALWAVGWRVARREEAGWGEYFSTFRRYFARSWALALTHLLVGGVLGFVIWLHMPANYPLSLPGELLLLVRMLVSGVFLLWLLISQYSLPLLLGTTRLGSALQQSFTLLLKAPLLSVALLGMTTALLLLSVLAPLLLFTIGPALVAVLSNKATLWLLEGSGESRAGAGNSVHR